MPDFSKQKDVERWLEDKPREVAIVISVRAALRAVPALASALGPRGGRARQAGDEIILPVLRATAASWVAAKYPSSGVEVSVADAAAMAATVAVSAPAARAASTAATAAAAAAYAASDVRPVTDAANATYAANVAYVGAARAAAAAAVASDARAIDEGMNVINLASRPLWLDGEPDWARERWARIKRALLALGENWWVWIRWYEARRDGIRGLEPIEVARALIGDEIWRQGPLVVNTEIVRLIEKYDRTSLDYGHLLEPIADSASDEVELARLFEPKAELLSDEHELERPASSLPSPSPATRFAFANGQFDVVPPTAWKDYGAQALGYHAKARALATALAERLGKTDAVPDVAGSVSALIDILGDDFAKVQPDQLRLASRSITAKARVYGHPAAQWEISAESVSAFFELADVLTDLQSFARTEIEAHENAIRELDLTPQNVAEAKAGLDFVSEGVLASQEIISERVEIAFEVGTEVSDTASDEQVKVAVEGDRTLLAANLALAVARQLGRDADAGAIQPAGGPPDKPPQSDPLDRQSKKPERPKRRQRARRAGSSENDARSWEDFAERVMARIHKKGPDALADATIQAAASAIKHAPKTAAALGAALVIWSMSNPIVLAGGGIAATMAWIGYELRRRNIREKK